MMASVPSRRSLVAVWLAAAVGFALLLARADATRSPLDDPDPALQRPGFLDLGALPVAAPQVGPDLPRDGRPAVVFFEHPGGVAALCTALSESTLRQDADLAVVASGPAAGCSPSVNLVVDPTGALARRFGLDVPRDGGFPVGYAVVDRRRRIRYRTLDPHVVGDTGEVETILRAAG